MLPIVLLTRWFLQLRHCLLRCVLTGVDVPWLGSDVFWGLGRDRNEGEAVGVETRGILEKEITQM